MSLLASLSCLANRKKCGVSWTNRNLDRSTLYLEVNIALGWRQIPQYQLIGRFLQWIRNLWFIPILDIPVGEAALWGEWRICIWTSQVPLLFLHFLIRSGDSDSRWDLLVKSSIRTMWGCAMDTGGMLHTHEQFIPSQRVGRDAHEHLKAGELSWWTGGTGTGHPVDTKGCIKTPSPLEDVAFAPGQAVRECWARDVTLRRMDGVLVLQAESPKHHEQRDVKQKGLRIPKL